MIPKETLPGCIRELSGETGFMGVIFQEMERREVNQESTSKELVVPGTSILEGISNAETLWQHTEYT